MGYKQTERRRRQPFRQQHRTLPSSVFRSFYMMISIFIIVRTIIIANHNAVVNSENVNHHVRYYHRNQLNHQAAEMPSAGYSMKIILLSLRGGGNNDANADVTADINTEGDKELNDEDLDEYIEFLLAHADDLASESENPLFRKVNGTSFVNSNRMDEKEYDDNEKVVDDIDNFSTVENNNEPNIPLSLDNVVKPLLVENVEDEKQLDAMIKTLVASIDDDDDDHEETQKQRDVEIGVLQEDTVSNDKAIIIEKENDDVSITTTALEAETIGSISPSIREDDVGVDVGVDEKLQVDINPIEQEGPQLADTNVDGGKESTLNDIILDTLQAFEVVDDERGYDEQQSDKEDSDEIVSFAAADSLLMGSENSDKFKEEQTSNNYEEVNLTLASIKDDVDVEEEETGELIDTFYLGSSAVESMPLPINGINTSSVSPTGEVEDSTIVLVESANDQVLVPQLDETATEKMNNTKNVDTPSMMQQYQGVWGTVKDFWYKKRGFGIKGNIKSSYDPPVRDYTKIYEKYYAHETALNLNNIRDNSQEENKYHMRAFMPPWGTVAKYFKPKIEFVESESGASTSCSTIQYSLGIQSATQNNVYNTHSALSVDSDEISTKTEEVFEEALVTIEENFEETDQSVDCTEKISSADGFLNKKSFARLWGTRKVTNETDQEKVTPNLYSLGIQGVKENTPDIGTGTDIETYDKEEIMDAGAVNEIVEDKEIFLVEAVDYADIAVSIEIPDKVEESFDVYSFDVSESSGESSTECIEETQQCGPDNHKIATIDIEFDSNEKVVSAASNTKKKEIEQEIEEKIAHSENASIEVNNEVISPEEPNVLINYDDDDDDEVALLVTENEIQCIEEGDSLINVDYAANIVVDNDNAHNLSESLESVLGETEEESSEIELQSDGDSAFEAVHEIIDGTRNAFVEENIAIIVPEGDEKFVEEEVEIDEIGSNNIAAFSEEVDFVEENENIGEHNNIGIDSRNDINDDDDDAAFSDDDSFSEDDEDVEQFNDVGIDIRNDIDDDYDEIFETTSKVYEEEYNKIHESMSSDRTSSLSEKMKNTNFLWNFLKAKGLEQWIMIAVMISEWFSFYILTPCLDSIDWIFESKGQNILQIGRTTSKWLNARGGALASSTSDNEDVSQVESEGDDCEQQGPKEEDSVELDSNEGTEPNSKEQDEQVLSVENENDSESVSEDRSRLRVNVLPEMPTRSRVRPNIIFRFLLDYGLIGHILIMELVLAGEWLQVYIPTIPSFFNYIVYDMLKWKKESRNDNEDHVYDRTGGLINLGDTSRVGKKPKRQTKKEDQNALDNLRNIGDVNQAKHCFLTQTFMERHSLGPYGTTISEIEVEFETESDSGWILEALTHGNDDNEVEVSSSPFETNAGVSLGREGPKVTFGMDLTLGKAPKRRKKKSSQLRTVVRQIDCSDSISSGGKSFGRHVSDRESGVMGRLRAAGANSLVGRNILGAYPGDLPPPQEAADASGLTYLARRYGYGEWSEDGDLLDSGEGRISEDYFMDDLTKEGPRRRSSRSFTSNIKKRKGRKRRSSQQKIGVNFDFDLGSTSQRPYPPLSDITTERREASSITSSLSSARRRCHRKSSSDKPRSRIPSPAMTRIGNRQKSKSRSSAIDKMNLQDVIQDTATRRRKTRKKTITPAMSLLEEKNKKISRSNSVNISDIKCQDDKRR